MAGIKYDVSDVEAGGGGEEPQPAMYKGKIVSMVNRKKNANGEACNDLEIVVDIGTEYVRKWSYVSLDSPAARWKLRELTDALGLPPKGTIDPVKITKEQPEVNVKIAADTDLEGNYRGKVKNLFKPGKLSADDEEDGEDEPGDTDYSSWTLEDLEAEIEERGLDMPSGRKTVAKLAEVLGEDDVETQAAQAEGEDDTSGEELPEEYADIEEWDADDLKAELEKLELKVSGRFSESKARDLIIEHVSANGGAPEAEEGATEDDYDEWEVQELKDEVETRNAQGAEITISGRSTKEKLIDALREDDKAAKPF